MLPFSLLPGHTYEPEGRSFKRLPFSIEYKYMIYNIIYTVSFIQTELPYKLILCISQLTNIIKHTAR